MLRFMKKDYEKYKKIITDCDSLFDEDKINNLLVTLDNIKSKEQTIILNSYHLSNLIGVKWKYLKKIIYPI